MIKNYMEDVVDEILPSVIGRYENICKCPKCIEDIKAIALNNLKPIYVATSEGEVYVKINELVPQFNANVVTQLTKAIDIVSKNPRHNKNSIYEDGKKSFAV